MWDNITVENRAHEIAFKNLNVHAISFFFRFLCAEYKISPISSEERLDGFRRNERG